MKYDFNRVAGKIINRQEFKEALENEKARDFSGIKGIGNRLKYIASLPAGFVKGIGRVMSDFDRIDSLTKPEVNFIEQKSVADFLALHAKKNDAFEETIDGKPLKSIGAARAFEFKEMLPVLYIDAKAYLEGWQVTAMSDDVFNRVARVIETLPDHSQKLKSGEIVHIPKALSPDRLDK